MSYSTIDKIFLNIGFHSLIAQEMISSIEDIISAKKINSISIIKPIFLTGLARAGSSLLLRLLTSTNQLATHTYRDMPFILCPMLWKKISSRHYLYSKERERTHSDGLKINFDTPEAFEEVIWKHYFKDKYSKNLIHLTDQENENEEFELFFHSHIKKIILNSISSKKRLEMRYVSKNNANISRIKYISKIFKDAFFIVPVRNPVEQVRSLMRQHENFLKIQSHDNFSKKYMDYLGHYEFGKSFKRINFKEKFSDNTLSWDHRNEDFWIEYWCDAYESLRDLYQEGVNIIFVIHERLCNDPHSVLSNLFSRSHLNPHSINKNMLSIIKAKNEKTVSPTIHKRSLEIYEQLKQL